MSYKNKQKQRDYQHVRYTNIKYHPLVYRTKRSIKIIFWRAFYIIKDTKIRISANIKRAIHYVPPVSPNDYSASYMAERFIKVKIKAIEYKGGKCEDCGYNKNSAALSFHHLRDKKYSWKKLRSKSWKRIKKELDKCICL